MKHGFAHKRKSTHRPASWVAHPGHPSLVNLHESQDARQVGSGFPPEGLQHKMSEAMMRPWPLLELDSWTSMAELRHPGRGWFRKASFYYPLVSRTGYATYPRAEWTNWPRGFGSTDHVRSSTSNYYVVYLHQRPPVGRRLASGRRRGGKSTSSKLSHGDYPRRADGCSYQISDDLLWWKHTEGQCHGKRGSLAHPVAFRRRSRR